MNFNKFLFKDSKGKPSITATAFILGFAVVNFKLIFSGLELGKFKMELFSGGEYAAALGALGAIYVLRRSTDPESHSSDLNDTKEEVLEETEIKKPVRVSKSKK